MSPPSPHSKKTFLRGWHSNMITHSLLLFFINCFKDMKRKKWRKRACKKMLWWYLNLFSKSLCCVITEPSCQDAPVIVALKKIEYKIFFNNFFLKKCVLGFFWEWLQWLQWLQISQILCHHRCTRNSRSCFE